MSIAEIEVDTPKQVCALCGINEDATHLVMGANIIVCYPCLGSAFAAIAKTYGSPRGICDTKHRLDATKRCMICDKGITAGNLIAYREPYCFCAECLQFTFEICLEKESDALTIVKF